MLHKVSKALTSACLRAFQDANYSAVQAKCYDVPEVQLAAGQCQWQHALSGFGQAKTAGTE